MPKNGRLWRFIEGLPRIDNELNLVFVNEKQKLLRRSRVWEWWSGPPKVKKYGVVKKLVKSGKIFKYLSPHHTRHTFNCIQQDVRVTLQLRDVLLQCATVNCCITNRINGWKFIQKRCKAKKLSIIRLSC